MIQQEKMKLIGHPVRIFNENNNQILSRSFFSNTLMIEKIQNLNNLKIKNKKQDSFSISKLYFAFFSLSIRKERFTLQITNLRSKKSDKKVKIQKFLTFSGQNLHKTSILVDIIKKKSLKAKVNIYRKYPVYSFSFLNNRDILVSNSSDGKIEIDKFRKKKSLFLIKSNFQNFMRLSSSTVFSSLFEASEGFLTNLFNYSSDLNGLQIFSIKHASILCLSSFRKEENFLDFCYKGKIWKSFDIISEKWIPNYYFRGNINSIEKSPGDPIFAIANEKSINIFDSRIGKIVINVQSNEKKLGSIKWFSNFPKLISSGTSRNATLFDFRFPSYEKMFELHKSSISMLNLSETKSLLLSSSFDKTSKIWLKKKFSLYKTFYDNEEKLINNSFSSSSLFLASLNKKNILKMWTC